MPQPEERRRARTEGTGAQNSRKWPSCVGHMGTRTTSANSKKNIVHTRSTRCGPGEPERNIWMLR
eukprot:969480-Prymnesium_polylepis.1